MVVKVEERSMRRAARKGFTLVEVMLVVIIIGVIAAFAIPGITGNMRTVRYQKAVSELKMLENQIELYEARKGKYPENLDAIASKLDGEVVPKDPWGNDYKYSKSGSSFTLTSGGQSGTESVDSSHEVD